MEETVKFIDKTYFVSCLYQMILVINMAHIFIYLYICLV